MDHGGAHIVVAVMRAMPVAVIVLLEFQFAFLLLARLRQANQGSEGMWFRNFVARLQIVAATVE